VRVLRDAPGALVAAGRVQFGTFSEPIADVNLIDARPFRVPVPRALRSLRLKEWQAFQFGNGRHFVVVALFNAKLLALAQVKVYDRRLRKHCVFERQLPGWAFEVPRNLLESRCEWSGLGATIRFVSQLAKDRLELQLDVAASSAHPAIVGRLAATAFGQRAPSGQHSVRREPGHVFSQGVPARRRCGAFATAKARSPWTST